MEWLRPNTENVFITFKCSENVMPQEQKQQKQNSFVKTSAVFIHV